RPQAAVGYTGWPDCGCGRGFDYRRLWRPAEPAPLLTADSGGTMRHIGRGPAVRVLARAVPAHDVVPGGEQARDDPGPRRAEPDEADTTRRASLSSPAANRSFTAGPTALTCRGSN